MSIILRRGKANRKCFERMETLGLYLSYNSVLKKQLNLGEDFTDPVQRWKQTLDRKKNVLKEIVQKQNIDEILDITISRDEFASDVFLNLDESFLDESARHCKFTELKNECTDNSISILNKYADVIDMSAIKSSIHEIEICQNNKARMKERDKMSCKNTIEFCNLSNSFNTNDNKFMIIGHDIDFLVKRRHMSKERQNTDFRLFHSIAVKNHVKIPEELLLLQAPTFKSVLDIPPELFFPTQTDEVKLQNEIKTLVARDLVKYIEELSWIEKYIDKQFPHQYSKESCIISEVVG